MCELNQPPVETLPYGYVLRGRRYSYSIQDPVDFHRYGVLYNATVINDALPAGIHTVEVHEYYPAEISIRHGAIISYPNNRIGYLFNKIKSNLTYAAILRKNVANQGVPITPVLEVFESRVTGTVYYVTPIYEGRRSLVECINERNFDEEATIQNIIVPVCRALHAAHCSKLPHLNMNPQNIVFNNRGEAELTGFDLVKRYHLRLVHKRAAIDQGVANPYIADKLHRTAIDRIDPSVDIYGLSAVLYHLLVTEMPIYDRSDAENRRVKSLLDNANCTPEFANALCIGLERDKNRTANSIQELLNLFPGCKNITLPNY